MATSSLSSLGLGSSVLTYDIIDKLRAADESTLLTPIDTKLKANSTKQSDLSILTTLSAALKSNTSTLSDEMSYLQRTTNVSNSAVSVTTEAGAAVQDYTIHVNNLAQRDIYESKAFSLETSTFASSDDTITIAIGSHSYDFDVTAATTITDLKNMINDNAEGNIIASILNVGGNEPYKLVIKSKDTGIENTITFSDTTNGSTLAGLTFNNIYEAKDASFTFNNVTIQRATNTITDLVVGQSIILNEAQADGEVTNVSVSQDIDSIKNTLKSFVSTYNDLMSNLDEATKYDVSSKTAGTFQGISQVKSLHRDIYNQLLRTDSLGRSLQDYGITLNSAGLLEIDSDVLNSKISTDGTDEMENFFRGPTSNTEDEDSGFFKNFNQLLADYITGSKSIFSIYNTSLTTEATNLTKNRANTVEKLDDRYAIMAKKFAAYDSIISNLNNQFQSLSLMIEQSYNNSN